MDRWRVTLELRGEQPAYLSPAMLRLIETDLAYLDGRVSVEHAHVIVELRTIGADADAAGAYASVRVETTLLGAGLVTWDAEVVSVSSDKDEPM